VRGFGPSRCDVCARARASVAYPARVMSDKKPQRFPHLPVAEARRRIEQARTHLSTAMSVLQMSENEEVRENPIGSYISPMDPMRTDELRDTVAAMRLAEGQPDRIASLDEEAERVELLAALEELGSAWEHSAALVGERYCALAQDIDDSLHHALSEMERRTDKTSATARALQTARRKLDVLPDPEHTLAAESLKD
jgi:hypothetical protein